jgi:tetratricopeptide (TPR) repeat protein
MNWLRVICFCIISVLILNTATTAKNLKPKNIKGKADKALLNEANFYFDLGSFHNALYDYLRLYEKYPDELFLKNRIGVLYIACEDYTKAEEFLK